MAGERARALFFLPSLGGGGAESHALRVMNHLDRSRFEVSLAVGRADGGYQHLLAKDVQVHELSSSRVKSSSGRLALSARALRGLVETSRPDILCSFMDGTNLAASAAMTGLRQRPALALVVQAPPSLYLEGLGRSLMRQGIRRMYPTADVVIALSHGVASDLKGIEPSLASRITVVHNACVDERILAAARVDRPLAPGGPRPVFIACGRLVPQKGFDDLVRAFALVVKDLDAELWIAGEGPLRPPLTKQISDLGLVGRARLLGFQADPQWLMARADAFVLSSVYEGFGNVVVEAMGVGTPTIATACPFGPDEIITDGRDGLLVPVGQSEALAAGMVRLMKDDALRSTIGRAGAERAMDFHAETIATQYAAVFEAAMAGKREAA